MKSSFKTIIIISVMALVVGAVLLGVSMSLLKWDFDKLDNNHYEAKTYTNSGEGITAIDIEQAGNLTVTIGDSISLSYYDSQYSTTTFEVKDGVLGVKQDRNWLHHLVPNFQTGSYNWVLTLPSDVSLSVSGVGVDVTLNDTTIDYLNVDSVGVAINLTNAVIGQLELDCVNVDMTVAGSQINDIEIDCVDVTITSSDALQISSMDIDAVDVDLSLTLFGRLSDYDLDIDAVDTDGISSNDNSLAIKHITINAVDVSGYLKYTK